ncbi:MAG: hypothetical protein R2752_11170 [Vicinamibacterales bacterium]
MARRSSRYGIPLFFVCALTTVAAVAAQNVLQQIRLSEDGARDMAMSSITSGSVYLGAVGRTVQALPPAQRASVVTGGIAWARAFLESPAFRPAWDEFRNQRKPAPPDITGSVDDEMKAQIEKQKQDIEETKKNIATLPPEMQAEMQAVVKQMEAMITNPDMLQMMRSSIEMRRTEEKSSYEQQLREWQSDYPDDVKPLIAQRLRAFLDLSGDVNFDAAVVDRDGRKVFADPKYEAKSSDWKMCYRVGKDATMAARAAAESWLAALK